MSGIPTAKTVDDAQRQIREVLLQLRMLAEQDLETDDFLGQWMARLAEVSNAVAARIWALHDSTTWQASHVTGTVPPDYDATDQRSQEILGELTRALKPIIVGQSLPGDSAVEGASLTAVWCPLIALGSLRAAVELIVPVDPQVAQRGHVRFVIDATDSVERHYLFAERRQAERRAEFIDEERKLGAAVHSELDLSSAAYALANEGRLLVGCDRLAVLVRKGRKYRVAAVSGQDDVDRRAGALRALETVTGRAAGLGEILVFPCSDTELAEDLTEALETYVDESHAKRLAIVPMISPPTVKPGETASARQHVKPLGAFVAEYFGETLPKSDERPRLEAVARCGTSALKNAEKHEELFLLPVWRTLGRWRTAALAPGTRRKTLVISSLVVAGLLALWLVPADFTAYCRGTLQPAERRRIFAPTDAIVKRVAVKHGQKVAKGQVLIELRDTDLDIAAADVEGRRTASAEQLAAAERTLFDEAKRLTAEERSRLSGERSQVREQIASLDRQLALYADKRRNLTVTSPIDGEITTWSADDLLENRPVRAGQQLLTVAAVAGDWELELHVPDHKSGRVVEAMRQTSSPLRVTYSPAVAPGIVCEGVVVEVHNSAELRGEDGNTVLVRAAIQPDELPQRRPGAEAAAHIHCGTRSLGYVWLRDVADFVRSKVLFRWF